MRELHEMDFGNSIVTKEMKEFIEGQLDGDELYIGLRTADVTLEMIYLDLLTPNLFANQ